MSANVRKETALAHLIQGATICAAARASGVSERQLRRWLDDPAYTARVRSAQGEALAAAQRRLTALVDLAIGALDDVMAAPDQPGAGVRRLAARDVLEIALRWHELVSVEERLSRLEGYVLAR